MSDFQLVLVKSCACVSELSKLSSLSTVDFFLVEQQRMASEKDKKWKQVAGDIFRGTCGGITLTFVGA